MPLFPLISIKSNPFRSFNNYPLEPEKIAALKESIQKTGFWDNIVARECDGGAELAYGHHRLTALTEMYGKNHKIELIIRKLTNETMFLMMAHENMREWGSNVAVEHETVRAAVVAYADGKISLPAIGNKGRDSYIRDAPSFKPICGATVATHPYTAHSLAKFLGWTEPGTKGEPQDRVKDALAALELIEEEKLLSHSDFKGLTKTQARGVIKQTRMTKSAPLAAKVGKQLSEGLKRGDFNVKQIPVEAWKMRSEGTSKPKEIPDIETFKLNLARDIGKILWTTDPLVERLNQLVKCKNDLDPESRMDLIKTLEHVAERFIDYAKQFGINPKTERKVEREERLRLN